MHKLYAVSYISFFDYNLTTKFIPGESEVEVMKQYLTENFGWDDLPETVEDIKQLAFDGDSMINAMEVPCV